MKYVIKQKIWSFKDKFNIKDEFGHDSYMVESKFFSVGNQLHVTDMQSNPLFFIKQKIFRLLPSYEIYKGEILYAMVKRKFTLLKPRIVIDQCGTLYDISGDIFSHEFTISRNGVTVATVSKTWLTISDTYGVDIVTGENDSWIITLVICIDQILHDHRH
jgi:uncharacterized protein YxjI